MQLLAPPDGTLRLVYDETLPLAQIGSLTIQRGSHVEPDHGGNWFVDLTPEHLGSWMNIVRKDNSAKNTIPTYGRRFQLQHFWRVLQQRFATLLHRKTGQLTTAFASYFVKSEDTIKGDLRHIKQKLGSDWAQRPAVFD